MSAAPNIDPRPEILLDLNLRTNPPARSRHGGQVSLQRYRYTQDGNLRVRKSYEGGLRGLVPSERNAFLAANDIRNSDGSALSKTIRLLNYSDSHGTELEFDFRGLDLSRWELLCLGAKKNPWAEVRNRLFMAREMLVALKDFHKQA
jgi:hypothetical protein